MDEEAAAQAEAHEDPTSLLENLHEYEAQLEQVSALLLDDPSNEELLALYDNLAEVIQLARDLQNAPTQAPHAHDERDQHVHVAGPAAQEAVPSTAASLLPPQVEEQIRHAQQRAALAGQGDPAWAIGAKCRAIYSGDSNWYNAAVEGVGPGGGFLVVFDGYGTKEEVSKEAIQLRSADDEGGYKGVAAPKRRRVDDSAEVQEMPKWLEIKETDDEKTRQKKRKLAKAYKSKARFARLDQQQKQKADAWQRFLAGKPKKKSRLQDK